MSNKNIKSITAPSFQTFVSILREEQKKQYMLVKFDYKNGYFCGVLSSDNNIPSSYHEALAAINPESKELVLRQIMSLVVAASGESVSDETIKTDDLLCKISESCTKEQIQHLNEHLEDVLDVKRVTRQRSQRNKK